MVDSRHSGDDALERKRFLTLFLRSEREIFRYVAALVPNSSEAEDIVQQTAIALWEKFDSYDPARPFTPWACRFALNKSRQWMDRRTLESGLAQIVLYKGARLIVEGPAEFQLLTPNHVSIRSMCCTIKENTTMWRCLLATIPMKG